MELGYGPVGNWHSYECGCSPLPQHFRVDIKVTPLERAGEMDPRITGPAKEPPDESQNPQVVL